MRVNVIENGGRDWKRSRGTVPSQARCLSVNPVRLTHSYQAGHPSMPKSPGCVLTHVRKLITPNFGICLLGNEIQNDTDRILYTSSTWLVQWYITPLTVNQYSIIWVLQRLKFFVLSFVRYYPPPPNKLKLWSVLVMFIIFVENLVPKKISETPEIN